MEFINGIAIKGVPVCINSDVVEAPHLVMAKSDFEINPKSSISPFAFGTFGSFGPSFACKVKGPLKLDMIFRCARELSSISSSSSSPPLSNHARRNVSRSLSPSFSHDRPRRAFVPLLWKTSRR